MPSPSRRPRLRRTTRPVRRQRRSRPGPTSVRPPDVADYQQPNTEPNPNPPPETTASPENAGAQVSSVRLPEDDPARQARQRGLDWARRIKLGTVVVAAVVGLAGLWYSNVQTQQANEQMRQANQQARDDRTLAKEGQITDRYTAAVGNLGEDKIDVRLGGIYALQRIMKDSHRDQPTIANVLAAYIRTHADKPSEKGQDVSADVHAALAVLATRDTAYDDTFAPVLRSVWLPRVELGPTQVVRQSENGEERMLRIGGGARLGSVNLNGAHLAGAGLSNAYLVGADLRQADLRGADLRGANLARAGVRGANFRGADLRDAKLEYNQLDSALTDATTKLPSGCAGSLGPVPPNCTAGGGPSSPGYG